MLTKRLIMVIRLEIGPGSISDMTEEIEEPLLMLDSETEKF
jgi:hypothetical protein